MVKYQIFLSSVSKELKSERDTVIKRLIETNNCFPIAMEFFPAYENTLKLLYRYLTESDFYVLILKDSEGTPIKKNRVKLYLEIEKEHPEIIPCRERFCENTGREIEDLTYTQIEYIFAESLNLKTLAFVYEGDSESKSDRIKKFNGESFSHSVKGWKDANALANGIVDAINFPEEDEKYSELGWIRRKNEPTLCKMRAAGIREISLNGYGFGEKLSKKLKGAKELDLFYTTGRQFIVTNQSTLASFIASGGKLRFLCGFPNEDFLSYVAAVEEEKFGERKDIHKEFELVIETLQHIYSSAYAKCKEKNCEDKIGEILVANSRTMFRTSILGVKYSKNEMWGWITLTLPPEKSVDMISIELNYPSEHNEENLLKTVFAHFDGVWKISEKEGTVFSIDRNTKIDSILNKQTPSIFATNEETVLNDNIFDNEEAKKLWVSKFENARKKMKTHKGNTTLIEVAAQHPLKDGTSPDTEFEARLKTAFSIWKEETGNGRTVEIYVPGSVHLDTEGDPEINSLAYAGREYLIKLGIPEEIILADDLNEKYDSERNWKGVYNSADECYIAAQYFKEKNFDKLICICSPNQVMRKTLLYINQEILPYVFSVPVKKMFHSPMDEIFTTIPYILFKDNDCQGENSEFARNSRIERMPDFASKKNK
ncbi:MAG: DUF4062 domain-containing protein [Lachnospiraceae bacterium]|nr:DUF4062 domain-containing protein [Lachnospiraceae bacterium]